MSNRKHPPRKPPKVAGPSSKPVAASRRRSSGPVSKPREASVEVPASLSAVVASAMPETSELAGTVSDHAIAVAIQAVASEPAPGAAETQADVVVPSPPTASDAGPQGLAKPEAASLRPKPNEPDHVPPSPVSLLDLQASMLDLYRQGAAASVAYWSSMLRFQPWAAAGGGQEARDEPERRRAPCPPSGND